MWFCNDLPSRALILNYIVFQLNKGNKKNPHYEKRKLVYNLRTISHLKRLKTLKSTFVNVKRAMKRYLWAILSDNVYRACNSKRYNFIYMDVL